jgi:DNA modification methylase
MTPYYDHAGITIYLGDCRDILPHLDPVDLVLTDPPYGVNLGEMNTGQEREKGQQCYETFSDTPEYLLSVIIPSFDPPQEAHKGGT